MKRPILLEIPGHSASLLAGIDFFPDTLSGITPLAERGFTVNDLNFELREIDAKFPGQCLSFKLSVRNVSRHRLVLPFPDITDLKFRGIETGKECDWYTHLFISAEGGALLLDADASRDFQFDARFQDVDCDIPEHEFSSFARWCTDMSPGNYTAQYSFTVDDDYFDPDSHWRLPQLKRQAESQHAVVWRGSVESNAITIARRPT